MITTLCLGFEKGFANRVLEMRHISEHFCASFRLPADGWGGTNKP